MSLRSFENRNFFELPYFNNLCQTLTLFFERRIFFVLGFQLFWIFEFRYSANLAFRKYYDIPIIYFSILINNPSIVKYANIYVCLHPRKHANEVSMRGIVLLNYFFYPIKGTRLSHSLILFKLSLCLITVMYSLWSLRYYIHSTWNWFYKKTGCSLQSSFEEPNSTIIFETLIRHFYNSLKAWPTRLQCPSNSLI